MYKETTICKCNINLIIWLDIFTQNYTKTSTNEITEWLSVLKKESEHNAPGRIQNSSNYYTFY